MARSTEPRSLHGASVGSWAKLDHSWSRRPSSIGGRMVVGQARGRDGLRLLAIRHSQQKANSGIT